MSKKDVEQVIVQEKKREEIKPKRKRLKYTLDQFGVVLEVKEVD